VSEERVETATFYELEPFLVIKDWGVAMARIDVFHQRPGGFGEHIPLQMQVSVVVENSSNPDPRDSCIDSENQNTLIEKVIWEMSMLLVEASIQTFERKRRVNVRGNVPNGFGHLV
jgi:hypothetical protein